MQLVIKDPQFKNDILSRPTTKAAKTGRERSKGWLQKKKEAKWSNQEASDDDTRYSTKGNKNGRGKGGKGGAGNTVCCAG